jgi:hypothetical protein
VPGQPGLDIEAGILQSTYQAILWQNGITKESKQTTGQEAVLIFRFGRPGCDHVEAINAQGCALHVGQARAAIAVAVSYLLPLMLAQNIIFTHIIEEKVNGRLGQSGAPFPLGLVKFDINLPISNGHFGYE